MEESFMKVTERTAWKQQHKTSAKTFLLVQMSWKKKKRRKKSEEKRNYAFRQRKFIMPAMVQPPCLRGFWLVSES